MKHRLKTLLARIVAFGCHVTGLRALFRGGREGVPVLMFHNVGSVPQTEYLPDHMKISVAKFTRLLRLLRRAGYRTLTFGQMVAALGRGEVLNDGVVLTFDDGYRDNLDVLLPILREHGSTATIFVQTGPSKGHLNWLHHYFWSLHRLGTHGLAAKIAERLERQSLRADLARLPPDEDAAEYAMKRLLKYEVTPGDRDRLLEDIFVELGGDEAELARSVYVGPSECQELDHAGVEIGAHTVNHLVLSTLDRTRQRKEIEGSLRDLESWLGHDVTSFAYPYGRAWDYNAETLAILDELGFSGAATAMPGLNDTGTPRYEMRRLAVNEDTPLSHLLCEIDGVFAWLARHGINLRA